MLCVCISEKSVAAVLQKTVNTELVEIRLDYASFSKDEITSIFSHSQVPKIATFRPGKIDEQLRQKMLMTAIQAGADYVDLEIENSSEFNAPIIASAKKSGAIIIISYHNYDMTPENSELTKIIDQCVSAGADIVKLACQANSYKDAARLLALYQRDEVIAVLGMGDYGKITRIAALELGSPFTFVAPDDAEGTAPGQYAHKKMRDILHLIGNN